MTTDPPAGRHRRRRSPTAPVEREFTVKSRSQMQQALRRFLHNRLAVGALIVYVVMLLIAFVGPLFYGWSFDEQDGNSLSAGPGHQRPPARHRHHRP